MTSIRIGHRVRCKARVYDRGCPELMHADPNEVGEVVEVVAFGSEDPASIPLRVAHVVFGSMVAVVSTAAVQRVLTHDDIDDLIDDWHTGADARELHEFLGWTWAEYAAFVERNEIPERCR